MQWSGRCEGCVLVGLLLPVIPSSVGWVEERLPVHTLGAVGA